MTDIIDVIKPLAYVVGGLFVLSLAIVIWRGWIDTKPARRDIGSINQFNRRRRL